MSASAIPPSVEVEQEAFREWAHRDGAQLKAYLHSAREVDGVMLTERREQYYYESGAVFEIAYGLDFGLEAGYRWPDGTIHELDLGPKPVEPRER